MKRRRQSTAVIVIVGVLVAVLGVFTVTQLAASDTSGKKPETPQAQAASKGNDVIDQKDPAPAQVQPQSLNQHLARYSEEMRNALSTSADGLIEVPNPAGGFTVDLQGRFRNHSVVAVDANGQTTTECLSGVGHPEHSVTTDESTNPKSEEE